MDDSRKNALFQKLESGNLVKLVIGGKRVYDLNGGVITQSCTYLSTPEPDIFGFATFTNEAWLVSADPIVYSSLQISYIVASVSLVDICASGCTIKFTSSSQTSFSIDADIYNET